MRIFFYGSSDECAVGSLFIGTLPSYLVQVTFLLCHPVGKTLLLRWQKFAIGLAKRKR